MRKFRKKPIVIEAIQFTNDSLDNLKEIYHLLGMDLGVLVPTTEIIINTLEGPMVATRGDWIIKGIKGELYPCKPDIFKITYDEVEENE